MAGIDNNRLFIVDNSLAQDTRWEMESVQGDDPLEKEMVLSHPIEDKPEVLDLAARAGAWYVYQAVFDTSDYIRDRIKRYHDYGIGVEGTILLGLDAIRKTTSSGWSIFFWTSSWTWRSLRC